MKSDGRKRSICFLTNTYPEEEGSYRGVFVKTLAERLIGRGYDIWVVAPRIFKRTPLREEQGTGPHVRRFPFWSGEKLLITYRRIPWVRMATYVLSGLYATWETARHQRCRLIHAHWVIPTGLMGILVGWWLGIPVIVHARGSDIHTFSRRGRLMCHLARFTLRRADAILAVSDRLKRTIVDEFGVSSEKVQVSLNGVDTSRFTPLDKRAQRRKLDLPEDLIIVLFVGGLVPVKGLPYLIRAVPALCRRHGDRLLFVIAGDGDLDKELRHMSRTLKIDGQIRFVGRVLHDEIPYWMNASDVFVLPSLDEGMPNTVIEALSCGLVVVASRVGGTIDVIQDGVNGLLVEPGSTQSIVDKLSLVLEDQRLCKKLRGNARQTVIGYDTDRQLQTLDSIYQPFLCQREGERRLE
jgi:glycosyltransferase involved in cell wall biosynthesis